MSVTFTHGALALAKAQGAMSGATKDSENPFFKSKYADLASCWEACRKPLSDNELSIVQLASAEGPLVTITTILMHSSGESVESSLTMTAKDDSPQGIGSTITYGRRYGLCAMVGIAPEDDDGNAASRPGKPNVPVSVPAGYKNWQIDFASVADEGSEMLRKAWAQTPVELRDYATKQDGLWLAKIKGTAKNADAKVTA